MADNDCCNSFGGRISITADGERMAPTPADIVIDPANIAVTGEANQDGSACFMAKPKLYGAEIALRNPCGADWNEKLRKCKLDVHIVEEDQGRSHIFTGARFTGDVKLNLANGTVSGIRIEGAQYQMIRDN